MKTLLVVCLALMLPGSALAATASSVQIVTVTVLPSASLSLDSAHVDFPPDSARAGTRLPQIGSVAIRAEAQTSDTSNVTLSVLAASDLRSGSKAIPISAISWAGTGLGYVSSGVLSDRQAQTLGRWDRSGVYDGTITYALTNEWDYAAGTYTTTITYTLTAL